ncbi:CPBP family intramembrane glutamic endopeptidase [Acidipila sp. EB88]|uniref:CPBP family intramembrane glutamic endopeptidase n=1 Tax=Acidipila sp. EB88 TaxID=2305226 RepID=UPI00131546B7|nr:CPBP family intramembrane glutamic endopeptidase [Acidipila sp. EB88]
MVDPHVRGHNGRPGIAGGVSANGHRFRALAWFALAGLYAIFARHLAAQFAFAIAVGPFLPLVQRLFFVCLLVAGFLGMSALSQRSVAPLTGLGLPVRPGLLREWSLGAVLGWAAIVCCVLPIALYGGLLVTGGRVNPGALGALLVDLATLLLAALSDELLFRGYPFERAMEGAGTTAATILLSLLFALSRSTNVGASPGSLLVALLLGFLLAMVYLRTRALWVGWGFHFAWIGSMALLFGLPVSGLTGFSPLWTTYTSGPAWLTGGGFGPEGSAVAILVLLGMLVVAAIATRELRHRWGLKEIVGAGIPMDVDAAAERQHTAAMGPTAAQPLAGTHLVQIGPAVGSSLLPGTPVVDPDREDHDHSSF